MNMNDYTVVIDDNAGTTKAYRIGAPTVKAATTCALRIFNAHHHSGGCVQHVFDGVPDFVAFDGRPALEIIDLFLIDLDVTP